MDPVKIAAMLVKDSNLFQESKRPDNGEPYEFKWAFDPKSKEYHHLKAQMQAFSKRRKFFNLVPSIQNILSNKYDSQNLKKL